VATLGDHGGGHRLCPPRVQIPKRNNMIRQGCPFPEHARWRSAPIAVRKGAGCLTSCHLAFVSVSCHFLTRWIWPSRGTDDHRIDATTCTNFVLSRDGTSFQAATAAQPMTAACAATYGSGIVFGRYLHCNEGIQCSADEVSLGCSTALPRSQARSPLSGNEMTSPPDVAATQLSSRVPRFPW
jgi:hypothetical protein